MVCLSCAVCSVVSRRYIDVCNCDVFSVVNVYLDHLKFCVVCINGRRYDCCSECNVVSDECDEPYYGSKRHSLQAVEQSQTAVQMVSNLPAPAMGA